ncbi:hypothetical protein FRUB_06538 [Fimbriiglobus ruber]|uniref:Uncharacterized protein n=1 Tax=Fimbriiglobus ruber TaxID=1908690 RepID=A0A225DFY4_9BACT|nr:hypothetical protein FRUB_06538 [Fimbriiglobus ruber]
MCKSTLHFQVQHFKVVRRSATECGVTRYGWAKNGTQTVHDGTT